MEKDIWADFDVIYAYTRAQALEDGELVDVSEKAKEAGITCAVAVTSALWGDINIIPAQSGQDVAGRLWDILYMFTRAAKESKSNTIVYTLIMPVKPAYNAEDEEGLYRVKAVIGPGDKGEPVITLMRPDED